MSIPVWQMVRSAMEHFDREVSYSEIKQRIWEDFPDANSSTITCQIIIASVNHSSRTHYPENKKPRKCVGQYDYFYNTGRGKVCPYDPEKHGEWEIYEKDDGLMGVRQTQDGIEDLGESPTSNTEQSGTFALESHLRDYLARNLNSIGDFGVQLEKFVDSNGVDGIEYHTDVGIIDILAKSSDGNFYVFELKLGRGPDAALGQILRYMGWVQKHLANGKKVQGIVLASEISEKLKYAATQVANVELMEYELSLKFSSVEKA